MNELEQDVVEEIRRIAARELDLGQAIAPESRLLEDLALDSVGLTVVAVGLEDRFRVKLSEEDSEGIRTVADLARLVSRRMEEVRS